MGNRKLVYIVAILISFTVSVFAHEIEGILELDGKQLPTMTRTQIPYDASFKEASGRTYVLWIAPDGAIAFHIEKERMKEGKAPLIGVWIIRAKENLKLPRDFEKTDIAKKDQIDGVEKLAGPFLVDWGNDLDYTISLDVKGNKGMYKFKGFLYGGPKNKKI